MIVWVKATKHKGHGNALVIKIHLVATIPNAFHVKFELESDRCVGLEDQVVQLGFTTLATNEMAVTFVVCI